MRILSDTVPGAAQSHRVSPLSGDSLHRSHEQSESVLPGTPRWSREKRDVHSNCLPPSMKANAFLLPLTKRQILHTSCQSSAYL